MISAARRIGAKNFPLTISQVDILVVSRTSMVCFSRSAVMEPAQKIGIMSARMAASQMIQTVRYTLPVL